MNNLMLDIMTIPGQIYIILQLSLVTFYRVKVKKYIIKNIIRFISIFNVIYQISKYWLWCCKAVSHQFGQGIHRVDLVDFFNSILVVVIVVVGYETGRVLLGW